VISARKSFLVTPTVPIVPVAPSASETFLTTALAENALTKEAHIETRLAAPLAADAQAQHRALSARMLEAELADLRAGNDEHLAQIEVEHPDVARHIHDMDEQQVRLRPRLARSRRSLTNASHHCSRTAARRRRATTSHIWRP